MTPEAQRIAIAEACGWRAVGSGKVWGDGQTFGVLPNGEDWHWQETPDYLNDLNAMLEAEKWLTRQQANEYCHHLCQVLGVEQTETFFLINATAAQRAEAFLRALNLWEDDK